jgi:hypothetical protein
VRSGCLSADATFARFARTHACGLAFGQALYTHKRGSSRRTKQVSSRCARITAPMSW